MLFFKDARINVLLTYSKRKYFLYIREIDWSLQPYESWLFGNKLAEEGKVKIYFRKEIFVPPGHFKETTHPITNEFVDRH